MLHTQDEGIPHWGISRQWPCQYISSIRQNDQKLVGDWHGRALKEKSKQKRNKNATVSVFFQSNIFGDNPWPIPEGRWACFHSIWSLLVSWSCRLNSPSGTGFLGPSHKNNLHNHPEANDLFTAWFTVLVRFATHAYWLHFAQARHRFDIRPSLA